MLKQIDLHGVHYHISDSTREFIQEKFSKFDYLKHLIVNGTIRIIKEITSFKVEVDINLKSHNKKIHFETTHELLYPAIENLAHKLKKILSDEHDKVTSHHTQKHPNKHESRLYDSSDHNTQED